MKRMFPLTPQLPRFVYRITFLSLLLSPMALFAQSPVNAQSDPRPERQIDYATEWLDRMARYFDENPDLKETRSSGWKPYNRAKWFYEPRLEDEIPSLAAARWNVWREKNQRARALAAQGKTAAANWFLVGPANMSGRILSLAFHPANADIVYVGSASGGLWKSTDGGDNWTTSTDELPSLSIGAVAVLPGNPDIVLIGTGEGTTAGAGDDGVGILKSTDAGQTWNTTSLVKSLTQGHGFHIMEANPVTGTIIAGANDGLYRSTDDGDTWTQIGFGGHYYDVKFHPTDSLTVYAAKGFGASGNNVKVSLNDGLTWAKLGTGYPASNTVGKTKIDISRSNPNVIYANIVNSSNHQTLGIYRSDDAGATWNNVYSSPNMTNAQGWYNLSLAVDPNDPDVVIAGGVSLYRSTNAGSTFVKTGEGFILGNETDVHWDHHVAVYEPGSNANIWVGNDGGVWRSTNDGQTWSSRREGISTYQFYDIGVAQSDPLFALGGAQDNGIPGHLTADQWFVSNLLADGFVCNIHPNNPDRVYAEWQFGNHVKSLDGGQTWLGAMTGITGSGAWLAPVAMDMNDPKQLFTSTSAGIFRTNNRMNQWTQVGNQTAIWIDASQASTDIVWTVNASGPWVSIDDGDSWAPAGPYGFATGAETKVAAHPTDGNTAFVTFSGYSATAKIAMTNDQGATWTNVTGDLPFQPVNTMIVDPNDTDAWYIGTDVGVWTSTNGGVNWTPYDTGLPNAVVTDLEIRTAYGKLAAGTYGRGLWETNLPTVPTDVAGASEERSLNLMLDPPYPNPVGQRAVFRFAARFEGPVALEIFDIRGRRVQEVTHLSRGDGIIRNVTWEPNGIASGVYFARLTAGNETITRRVVFTR